MDRWALWAAIFVTLVWFFATFDFSADDRVEAGTGPSKMTILVGLR